MALIRRLDLSLLMTPSPGEGSSQLLFEDLEDELPILLRSELGMTIGVDLLRKGKGKRRGEGKR